VSRLLLVRHGQSTWNADGRWQGRADPPLSELGIRQAEAVAEAVVPGGSTGLEITGVWTSPLERARRTAEIVSERLGTSLNVDARLEERDAGEWTGLTRVEIEAAWPGYLAEYRRPPAFELDEMLVVRALEALEAIASAAGSGPVLVITHAGVIRGVERHLGAESEPVPNLGGREVLRAGPGLELGDRILLVDPAAVEVTTPRQI
jgi:broad specificity phosphatase PhoE